MIHLISSGTAVQAPESKLVGGPVAQPTFAAGDTVVISSRGHAAKASVDVDRDGDSH